MFCLTIEKFVFKLFIACEEMKICPIRKNYNLQKFHIVDYNNYGIFLEKLKKYIKQEMG